MKFKLCALMLATIISCPITASATELAPQKCPNVTAIKRITFDHAQIDSWLGWMAYAPTSKYDTETEWYTAMIIQGDGIKDANDALRKSNTDLQRVKVGTETPEKNPEGLICGYFDNQEDPKVTVITMTPSDQQLNNLLAKATLHFKHPQK